VLKTYRHGNLWSVTMATFDVQSYTPSVLNLMCPTTHHFNSVLFLLKVNKNWPEEAQYSDTIIIKMYIRTLETTGPATAAAHMAKS